MIARAFRESLSFRSKDVPNRASDRGKDPPIEPPIEIAPRFRRTDPDDIRARNRYGFARSARCNRERLRYTALNHVAHDPEGSA